MPSSKPSLRGHAERNALVEANQPLVRFVAQRFSVANRIDFEELVAMGQVGLLRAAELWNPSLGTFATVAYSHIHQAIKVAIWQYSGVITMPRSAHEAARGYYDKGRRSTAEAAQRALGARRISVHDLIEADELTIADHGPDDADNRDEIEALLDQIPEIEARVIRLRYGLDDGHELTPSEVGRRTGIDRRRVWKIEARGLKRIRKLAANQQSPHPSDLGTSDPAYSYLSPISPLDHAKPYDTIVQ